MDSVYLTPLTLSLLPSTLACLQNLKELKIFWHGGDDKYNLLQQQTVANIFMQLKVESISVQMEMNNDYSEADLQSMINALRKNTNLKDLTMELLIDDGIYLDRRHKCVSPNGWDLPFYRQCRLLQTMLEKSNKTLRLIDLKGVGNSPSDRYGASRHYGHLADGLHYLTALNHFGRGQIRSGEYQNIGELLAMAKEELLQGEGEYTYGFDFLNISYGLLRDSPSIWTEP